ncbi:MAG: flippase [Candidatus Kerfeldbacteria bacterium]|nr:flippase [Candidatus Kerfeldbacteria bacterium]
MGASGRIAKNTTYLTIASILQKVISFVYYGYLASGIGTANLGKYDTALRFSSIFIIFMDFGLGALFTREVAKDEDRLQQHFNRFFSIKIVLIAVTLAVYIVATQLSHIVFHNVDSTDVYLYYLAGCIIVLDTLTFTLFTIFRSLKQMQWEAFGILIYQSVIYVAGILFLHFHLPIVYVLLPLLFGSFIQLVYMWVLVKWKTGLTFHFQWQWKDVKTVIFLAAPFAIAGIFFRLSGTADGLMLKIMISDSHAGWFALPYKLAFALTVLPGAFASSYFPVVSHYYKHAKDQLHLAVESGIFYMFLLSMPIVGGVLVLADEIILRGWGTVFAGSITTLRIFMIALPFIFLNYPIGNFLNAVNRQKLNTVNMCISLVVNIILNFILIPYYTFNGAAIAAVISNVLLVLLGLPWVYRISGFSILRVFKKFAATFFAAGVMTVVLYFVQYTYNILLLIIIGGVLYATVLLLTNGLTKEELYQLKKAILKRG